MSETEKRIRVFAEGDQDRAVLNGLKAMRILPELLDIAVKPRREFIQPGEPEAGIDRVVFDSAQWAAAPGTRAIALRDMDDLTLERLSSWLSDALRALLPGR